MKRKIRRVIMLLIATVSMMGCGSNESQKMTEKITTIVETGNEEYKAEEYVPLYDKLEEQLKLEEEIKKEFAASEYTFQEPLIILDPYGVSPLTALILFHTEKYETVTVTIAGKTAQADISQTFEKPETDHIIPVYGLYAGMDNRVTLSLESGEQTEVTITTEPLPSNVKPAEVITQSDNFKGITFVSPTSGEGLYVVGYDINGDVRWLIPSEFVGGYEMTRIDNGHLVMADGRISALPYYGTGLLEFNPLGKVYRQYDIPGAFHHDFIYLNNGNILICSEVTKTGCVEDAIVEIDAKSGELIRTIDLKNILPYKEAHSLNYSEKDWFHNNSIDYDEESNAILLSGRHIDGVISIDYITEKLNWILGSPEGWSSEWQQYFFTPKGNEFEWQWAQHSAIFIDSNTIMLFDNGNNKSKNKDTAVDALDEYSRGVVYRINEDDMTVEQSWQFGKERGVDFYSMYISEVEYWGDNHYLVHSGGIIKNADGSPGKNPFAEGAEQYTNIVELEGNDIVYELKIPANTFRSERMSLYAEDEVCTLGEAGERLGEFEKTELSAKIVTPEELEQASVITEDFEIMNEPDRIVVSGSTDNEEEVYIVLYSENDIRVYDASSPKVQKQISKTGITGEYSVWIKLGEKIYNTDKKISF